MTKQEIFDRINEIIKDEKGLPIKMDDLFTDSELDSLGTVIALITIGTEFGIFNGNTESKEFEELTQTNMTMRDLVNRCKLQTINS